MSRRGRIARLAVLAAALLVPAAGTGGPVPDPPAFFWVVNTQPRTLTVIDAASEQVDGTVSLGGQSEPDSIAFSTIEGLAGAYAFVSQGADLRVVDTAARTVVDTIALDALIPAVSIRLRGLQSARLQRFVSADGTPQLRAFLHANADVETTPGRFEPWFIVLDQEALAGLTTEPPVQQAAPLAADGLGAEATDVTVLSWPEGDEFQRAWHTLRAPDRIIAVRVGAPRQLQQGAAMWNVTGTIVRPVDGALGVPDRLVAAAPFTRTPVLLPEGPNGTVHDLYTDRPACAAGDQLRGVAVGGPGPGAYDTFALDANGQLHRLGLDAAGGCDATQSFPTGATPVDLDTLGEIFFQKVLVTNRDSDDVTVVRADGTVVTIPLSSPKEAGAAETGPSCTSCPSSGRTERTPETSCSVEELKLDGGGTLSWVPVGCAGTVDYVVWCTCEAEIGCPADCDGTTTTRDTPLPAPLDIGDSPWEPLGSTAGTTFPAPPSTTDLQFSVTLDDMLP